MIVSTLMLGNWNNFSFSFLLNFLHCWLCFRKNPNCLDDTRTPKKSSPIKEVVPVSKTPVNQGSCVIDEIISFFS